MSDDKNDYISNVPADVLKYMAFFLPKQDKDKLPLVSKRFRNVFGYESLLSEVCSKFGLTHINSISECEENIFLNINLKKNASAIDFLQDLIVYDRNDSVDWLIESKFSSLENSNFNIYHTINREILQDIIINEWTIHKEELEKCSPILLEIFADQFRLSGKERIALNIYQLAIDLSKQKILSSIFSIENLQSNNPNNEIVINNITNFKKWLSVLSQFRIDPENIHSELTNLILSIASINFENEGISSFDFLPAMNDLVSTKVLTDFVLAVAFRDFIKSNGWVMAEIILNSIVTEINAEKSKEYFLNFMMIMQEKIQRDVEIQEYSYLVLTTNKIFYHLINSSNFANICNLLPLSYMIYLAGIVSKEKINLFVALCQLTPDEFKGFNFQTIADISGEYTRREEIYDLIRNRQNAETSSQDLVEVDMESLNMTC